MSGCLELEILDLVSQGKRGVPELAAATGRPRNTIYRKVKELIDAGWLAEGPESVDFTESDNETTRTASLGLGRKAQTLWLREIETAKAAAHRLIKTLTSLTAASVTLDPKEGSRISTYCGDSAICIGCGCDDDHACENGCHWLVVNREAGKGVCSNCVAFLETFNSSPLNASVDTRVPLDPKD